MKLPKNREIKYLNRDFDSILSRLVNQIKYYYPDSFNDFSPASPGMVMLEMVAYVGDVLNYYIDHQTKETLLYHAQDKQSVYNIAQAYGYKIRTSTPATVPVALQCLVPVIDGIVQYNYAPILYPGTQVKSESGNLYTIFETVNFKQMTVKDELIQPLIGHNINVILRKNVYAYSVAEKTFTYRCDDLIKNNMKIYLPDTNIVKIKSVVDEDGHNWYQVLNMANDLIMSTDIEYNNNIRVFKRIKTNKRFKKLVDKYDATFLYFGSKQRSNRLQSELYQSFYNYDYSEIATPSLLLLNNNYGQVPYGKTLTITYYVSSPATDPALSVNEIASYRAYNNDDYDNKIYQVVLSSLNVNNYSPVIGGLGLESIDSIKENAIAFINSQNRLVTQEDYINASRLLPAEFGNIAKSHVQKNPTNNVVQLYVLSYNNEKHLVQTNYQIKSNLGQFLQKYRMHGDVIDIKNAYNINVGCQFSIVADKQYSKKQILYKAIQKIKEIMNIDNFEIGSPIDINYITAELLGIKGVINVVDVKFVNKVGEDDGYSMVQYDMNTAFDSQVKRYFTSITPSIFQLKYPNKDIVGSIL